MTWTQLSMGVAVALKKRETTRRSGRLGKLKKTHVMKHEERLKRFYQIHCPQKVERASEDIRAWRYSGVTESGSSEKEKSESRYASVKYTVNSTLGGLGSAVGQNKCVVI